MDGEYHKQTDIIKESEDDGPSISNILQSSGIRRSVSSSDEMDGFVLGNGLNLLFHVCPIFWLILFTKSK